MSVERVVRRLRDDLDDAGLRGSFLVRDVHNGDEIGIEPDIEYPIASLVKLPLALATLDRIRAGELDGGEPVRVDPGDMIVAGPTGLSRFRHPAYVAIDDLLYLSMSISDNTATDILFGLTPPDDVAASMRASGFHGISVRHPIRDISETVAAQLQPADAHLAYSLAAEAGTSGRGHRIPQLDVTVANSGTARAFVDLLQALWKPSGLDPWTAERVRALMAGNVFRQRLAPDFSSDATKWSSRTGSLLNLRHEVGVVEHADGQVFAVAALTESRVPAFIQPAAEAVMGRVARTLRDQVRVM
ncbi:serine hydrolase [Phytoactinopolyspora mesophila]|uniref:Serine hydrolase n=1 Tax=Phytoactinopolyspora mesophila TaxID=2650750 RepID=A0A7K3LZU9_9ACTN|nr:serine hydrolase [Phytoactinopolyspora mesophila]NDL56539.1 serine hydrolase [Phytoactinopolyspora mesophila]